MFLRAAWIFIGIIENSDSPAGAYTSLSFYDWERRYAILQFLIAGVFVLTMEISHLLVASMEESNVVVAGLIIFSSMYGFLMTIVMGSLPLDDRDSHFLKFRGSGGQPYKLKDALSARKDISIESAERLIREIDYPFEFDGESFIMRIFAGGYFKLPKLSFACKVVIVCSLINILVDRAYNLNEISLSSTDIVSIFVVVVIVLALILAYLWKIYKAVVDDLYH